MKNDLRKLLYKNKDNIGNFYTKPLWERNAKRKYIVSFASDDILLPDDILSSVYEEAVKNNLDIIQFDYLW